VSAAACWRKAVPRYNSDDERDLIDASKALCAHFGLSLGARGTGGIHLRLPMVTAILLFLKLCTGIWTTSRYLFTTLESSIRLRHIQVSNGVLYRLEESNLEGADAHPSVAQGDPVGMRTDSN
jgi:hypothetical protein